MGFISRLAQREVVNTSFRGLPRYCAQDLASARYTQRIIVTSLFALDSIESAFTPSNAPALLDIKVREGATEATPTTEHF